ncbi:MAG: hypothetical protein ACI4UV_03735, partial [Victivallales bacterium]
FTGISNRKRKDGGKKGQKIFCWFYNIKQRGGYIKNLPAASFVSSPEDVICSEVTLPVLSAPHNSA